MPQDNLRKTNYELRDLCDQVKRELLLDMACQAVATVVKFDPIFQTITAQLAYGSQYLQRDPRSGKYAPVLVKYPLLVDIPVVILGGGGGSITFPILPGDDCLIMFNDRDIDNWYAGNSGGAVASDRLHSMSDGFALIGIYSRPRALKDYDTERIAITYRLAGISHGKIGVGEKIVIKNLFVDWNQQLGIFLTGLSVFLAATAAATTASQIAAAAATFVPIATQFRAQMALLFETEAP